MTANLAVGTIELYQQYLSPYKGFRCAHRALHGRASCSEFAKRVVQRVGLAALPELLRRRFDKCARAAAALKSGAKTVTRLLRRKPTPAPVFAAVSATTPAPLDYESPHTRQKQKQEQQQKRDSACWDASDCASCTPDLGELGCNLMTSSLDGASACDACACDLSV